MNDKEYILIEGEEHFSSFIENIDWEDAFIKEAHIDSPSFLEDDSGGIVAPDSNFTVKLSICLPENTFTGIELLFEEVEELAFFSRMDILPTAIFRFNEIEFRLVGSAGTPIRCRKLSYCVIKANRE